MRRIATILAVLAALLLTDVHWSVMQSITWARMIAIGESEVAISKRIADTFSGHHRCIFCFALEAERSSDQEETLDLITKFQVLGTVSPTHRHFSPPRRALFSLYPGGIRPPSQFPSGIDHPPRV
ncbi:MAG: hypothetical protein AAGA96_04070 [Verrucomicrobiota bacterium]